MDNPNTQTVEGNQEGQQQQPTATGTETTETSQPLGQEEKLYAGRFKTPEELEEHYKLSSQEGIRLNQENQRLNQLMQQFQRARTPAKQEAIRGKIDDVLSKHFEPDTAKVLSEWGNSRNNIIKEMIREELTTMIPASATVFSNLSREGRFMATTAVGLSTTGEPIGSSDRTTVQLAVPPLISGP